MDRRPNGETRKKGREFGRGCSARSSGRERQDGPHQAADDRRLEEEEQRRDLDEQQHGSAAQGRVGQGRDGHGGRRSETKRPGSRSVSRRRRPDKAGCLTFLSGDGPGRPGRRTFRRKGDQGRSGASASSTGGPERAAASSASSRCQIKMEWPTLASGRGWCRSQAQRRQNRSFS
jgi:hypothetical protein